MNAHIAIDSQGLLLKPTPEDPSPTPAGYVEEPIPPNLITPRWTGTAWIDTLTPQQATALRQAIAAQRAAAATTQITDAQEPRLATFATMTPAAARTYAINNSATLQAARAVIGDLAAILAILARRL